MDLDSSPLQPRVQSPKREAAALRATSHPPEKGGRLEERPGVRPGMLHHFTVKEVGRVSEILGRMRSHTAAPAPAAERSPMTPALNPDALAQPLQMVSPLKGAKSWKCLGYRTPDVDVAFDGPPAPEQVRQGYIGDCWAIAVIAQAAALEPHELERRITKVAPHVYDVRLGGPNNLPERVHRIDTGVPEIQVRFSRLGRKMTMGTHASLDGGVLWPVLFEKAIAAELPNGYEDIGHGGWAEWAIGRILDRPFGSSEMPSREDWDDFQMEGFFKYQLECGLPTVFSIHVPDGSTAIPLPEGMSRLEARKFRREQRKEMLSIQNMAQEVGLLAREDSRHAYWLYDYDPINQMVKLANPHGMEFTSDWISFDQLRTLAYHVSYGELRNDGT